MDQGKKKKGLCVVFILGPLKQKHSREKVRQGGAHMAKSLYANKLMKSEDWKNVTTSWIRLLEGILMSAG